MGETEQARPLIGVEDMSTPRWAEGYEATAGAGMRAMARKAPQTVALAVRWAWQCSPRLTVLAGVVQLAFGAATSFGLLATADVFTRLLAAGPTAERVVAALPALAVVVVALAIRALLQAAVAAVVGALMPRVEQQAADELHAALLNVELAAFDDPDFTHLVERATSDGPFRIRSCVRDTGDLIAALVAVAAAVVTAGILHPLLAPVVMVASLPNGWAAVRSARLMFASYVRMLSWRRRSWVTSELITRRDPAAEVRAFTTQQVLLGEHRRIADRIAEESVRIEQERTLIQLVGRAAAGISTGLAYLVLGLLIYTGSLELALAGAAALAMRTASAAVSNMIFEVNNLYEASFYVDLYRTCVTETADRRRTAATATLTGDPAEITLSGVSFTYPGQDEPAVQDLSLTVRKGEVIALVGENGSGKTTLAKLITGLYLPAAGTVTWDGIDITTLDQRDLHERVSVVLQDPLRWPMTAENNVRIGRLAATDPENARLAAAAAHSGADTLVSELPAGWSTVLSRDFQGGRDLSGGQWQRLSVARGLYRNAPLVIADEPTAALDARAEHAVFATLRGLDGAAARRITVLVTHRLANVRHADQILVLEKGRLIEHGRHADLMARHGTYHDLFTLQSRAYTDTGTGPTPRAS